MTYAIFMNMETLGPLVRTTRERKGIRAADLAYQIGKDPSYLSKLERDLIKDMPTPEVLQALSKALDIPEIRLLKAMGFLQSEDAVNVPTDPRVTEFLDLLPYVDDVVMGALRRMTLGTNAQAGRRAATG